MKFLLLEINTRHSALFILVTYCHNQKWGREKKLAITNPTFPPIGEAAQ